MRRGLDGAIDPNPDIGGTGILQCNLNHSISRVAVGARFCWPPTSGKGGEHTRIAFAHDVAGEATDLVLNPGPWQITGRRIN